MEKDEKVVEESVEEAKEAEPIEGADQPEQPQAEGETHAPNAEEPQDKEPQAEAQAEPEPKEEPQPQMRMFTQEQVNELVGKARSEGRRKGYEQARAEALSRYGVETDDELDGLFANGTKFGELSSRCEDFGNRLRDTQAELALVRSGVLPERMSDVRAILGANGLDINEENIAHMAETHPEWTAKQDAKPKEGAPIPQPKPMAEPKDENDDRRAKGNLGLEPNMDEADRESNEREQAMRLLQL